MTPEEYEVHYERVLWLSEHPLTRDQKREDVDALEESRQATLREVAK